MVGIVSHDFFSELSNREVAEGIAGEQKDHMLQVCDIVDNWNVVIIDSFFISHYSTRYQRIFIFLVFQTYVRNNYNAHLQEILLTLQNEYTDWEDSVQHPTSVRNQVSYKIRYISYSFFTKILTS